MSHERSSEEASSTAQWIGTAPFPVNYASYFISAFGLLFFFVLLGVFEVFRFRDLSGYPEGPDIPRRRRRKRALCQNPPNAATTPAANGIAAPVAAPGPGPVAVRSRRAGSRGACRRGPAGCGGRGSRARPGRGRSARVRSGVGSRRRRR